MEKVDRDTKLPKINCLMCVKRRTCSSLCKKAERYADQDHVNLTEYVISGPGVEFEGVPWPEPRVGKPMRLNNTYLMVAALISSGIPRKIICEKVGLSRKQLSNILHEIKMKLEKIS